MEGVHLAQRNFVELSIHFEEWINSGKKREWQGSTSSLLYTSESIRKRPGRRLTSFYCTVPQKVHYQTYWKRNQDAVHWIRLSRAQDQGLRFWQTKSFAIITYATVSADCTDRVTSQNGDRVIFERLAAAAACSRGRRYKHLETACNLGIQSRSARRYETRHGSGTSIQETGAREFWSGRWYSSQRKRSHHNEANTQDIERVKIGLRFWKNCFEQNVYSRRPSEGEDVFSRESSRAIFEKGNVELIELKNHRFNDHWSFMLTLRFWRNTSLQMR